jgi:hypothetical protein
MMTRLFTDETLADISEQFRTIGNRTDRTVLRYTYHAYKDPRAQEFAHQGFVRRVRILERCIQNAFELIPPDTVDRVPASILSDAQINIQAFIANVYGCADNLAWVWVHETGLVDKIDRRKVGLRSHNLEVRRSLSPEMQAYLAGLDRWFTYIVDYRDALAHRIPLYIPERVRAENVDTYNGLTDQMTDALNTLDAVKYECLADQQNQLLEFQPFITHSVTGTTAQVAFHPQMIADFRTVEELGEKMFSEIKAA